MIAGTLLKSIDRFFRVLFLIVFGIVPGLLISFFSLAHVFSGSVIWGFYWTLVTAAAFYGMYTLVRFVFDWSLEESRLGMFCGSLSMLAVALSPVVHTLLEEYLQIPSPITNMGLAGIWSLIALFPTFVFAFLAIKSWNK